MCIPLDKSNQTYWTPNGSLELVSGFCLHFFAVHCHLMAHKSGFPNLFDNLKSTQKITPAHTEPRSRVRPSTKPRSLPTCSKTLRTQQFALFGSPDVMLPPKQKRIDTEMKLKLFLHPFLIILTYFEYLFYDVSVVFCFCQFWTSWACSSFGSTNLVFCLAIAAEAIGA